MMELALAFLWVPTWWRSSGRMAAQRQSLEIKGRLNVTKIGVVARSGGTKMLECSSHAGNRLKSVNCDIFSRLADAGSFSRAAKRLGVSQPAVSQQMRDLEIGLRAVLLQRRGKRTTLTSAGLLFQEHARTILRQIEKSLQEIGNEPGELRGTLRLGVIPYLNVALMPQLLG